MKLPVRVMTIVLICLSASTRAWAQEPSSPGTIETHFGSVTLDAKGYPDQKGIDALYEELDFQRAAQTYLWAIPAVGMEGQRLMQKNFGATGPYDSLLLYGAEVVGGMLTPNSSVGYVITVPNLLETGPLVLEVPAGEIAGILMDYWQRWIADVGQPGPTQGKSSEKLLVLGPGQETPDGAEDYRIVRSLTAGFLHGSRVLNPKKDIETLPAQIRMYPFSERANPKPKLVVAKGDTFLMTQPVGMPYWDRVNDIIQCEPIAERDRLIYAMLRPLGIEKGKPFTPTESQKRILEEGARMGNLMSLVTSFANRDTEFIYRSDADWRFPLSVSPTQRQEAYDELDQRADYTYEAYGVSPAMKAETPGVGSGYLSSYRDKEGKWYDGKHNYHMVVPPNVPIKQFWEVTVYNLDTRATIVNKADRSAISSRTEGVEKNADGSVDLYFGAAAPPGKKSNWIKTNPGEYWFCYFRVYGPTEPFINKSWPLPDIEKVK
jgi:hypothetical protein